MSATETPTKPVLPVQIPIPDSSILDDSRMIGEHAGASVLPVQIPTPDSSILDDSRTIGEHAGSATETPTNGTETPTTATETPTQPVLPVQILIPDSSILDDFRMIDNELVDAFVMKEIAPDTFHSPSDVEISRIDFDCNVVVNDGNRSFWTRVVYTLEDRIFATVEDKTYEHGYDLNDRVSFCTRHVHASATDKVLAQVSIQERIDSGVEKEATHQEKLARHLPNYLHACWSVFPDPFKQGVGSLEQAKISPVDPELVIQHFTSVHPTGLDKMNLVPDDIGICHMNSKSELRASLLDMKAKGEDQGLRPSHDIESDVDSVYHSVMNLLLQPRIYSIAYDE